MSSAAWMASAFMSVLLRKWWAVPVAGVGVRWADRGAHDVTGEPPRPGRGPRAGRSRGHRDRSEEHTSELQSRGHLVCRLLLEKNKTILSDKYNHYLYN